MAIVSSPKPIKMILFACIILLGVGSLIAHKVMIKDCPACKGSKFITAHCPECRDDGRPRVTCSSCNGSGKGWFGRKCRKCEGMGKLPVASPKCPDCKGTKKGKLWGTCNKCNGAGFYPICSKCKYRQLRVTCPKCIGTGRQE